MYSADKQCSDGLFKGKVIIVTGSSSGLGAGTAVKFAAEGASGIIIHGRNESALQTVKEQCEKAGRGNVKVHMCVGDITDDNVRKNLVNSAVDQFGQLDILINNAGIGILGRLCDVSMDTYDQIFDVNVRSLMAITQLAMPHLIKTSGNIVNISSAAALKPTPMGPFYACSKAAVDYFTKCIALDVGPKGVRVNSVNPGFLPETAFVSREKSGANENLKARVTATTVPLGRTGTVDEISDAILFLASDKAKFITGTIFPVDGGFSRT